MRGKCARSLSERLAGKARELPVFGMLSRQSLRTARPESSQCEAAGRASRRERASERARLLRLASLSLVCWTIHQACPNCRRRTVSECQYQLQVVKFNIMLSLAIAGKHATHFRPTKGRVDPVRHHQRCTCRSDLQILSANAMLVGPCL